MKKFNNNNLLFEISSAVFVARSRCGFTQAQLAKKVGTLQPGIARLENPTSLPSLTLLNKVANALDQNIIFGFEPKDPKDIRFQRPKDESLNATSYSLGKDPTASGINYHSQNKQEFSIASEIGINQFPKISPIK